MTCNKCNHKLPDDSEFCQYCGARIEKKAEPLVVEEKVEFFAVETPPTLGPAHQKETPILIPVLQPSKPVRNKYCSRCGSTIDRETKKCTGCGKQYFPGLRFTKFTVTVITMALVIAALSAVCVLQFLNVQTLDSEHQTEIDNLESKISSLEQQVRSKETTIKTKDATIKRLEGEIDDLEDEAWDNWSKLFFFDTYAEIVPNDGTYTYHKWGCSKMADDANFWIFNTAAAEDDYKKCPYCH